MTGLQRKALQLLADKGGPVSSIEIAEHLVPEKSDGWTQQGAVRWAHGYMSRLIAKRLVRVSHGPSRFEITDKGREILT